MVGMLIPQRSDRLLSPWVKAVAGSIPEGVIGIFH